MDAWVSLEDKGDDTDEKIVGDSSDISDVLLRLDIVHVSLEARVRLDMV